jgi:2-(1,2-epoxy-1,2-dihydrophenyl)acetyl-CoA isomerase
MSEPILKVEKANKILTLTLNRPERLNALGGNMRDLLLEELAKAEHDADVRTIVITGAGRAFCSGGDVKEMSERLATGTRAVSWDQVLNPSRDLVVQQMRNMPKPIIAAINGVAAGAGFNLALACDMRIASDRASFTQSFVKRGLHPDWGGTYFLPRMVGTAKACELIFTGDVIDVRQAFDLNLLNRIVPHDSLMQETYAFAKRFADGPPVAIGMAKRGIYSSLDRDIKSALEYESFAQRVCQATEDHKEGVRAFVEKRPPVFSGR